MKIIIILTGMIICGFVLVKKVFFGAKKSYQIETSDIGRFWQAYGRLKQVHSTNDSIVIIQHGYLDQMSAYGKKYIELRGYTAAEHVKVLRKYPKYFVELRKKTDQLLSHKPEIDSAFSKLNVVIPNFNYPDVCFAIGCFRGGGTKTKNKEALLIGCEIALADSTMDRSEFKGTLQAMFSHADGNVSVLIAHESIHCQQWNGQNNSLLSIALAEGGADFFTELILHSNINKSIDSYGVQHECELWKEFEPQMNSTDISQWFYNSSINESRPADLGYFMGRRICESYYNQQPDKKKAIVNLLNRGKYQEVMRESGYTGYCESR